MGTADSDTSAVGFAKETVTAILHINRMFFYYIIGIFFSISDLY